MISERIIEAFSLPPNQVDKEIQENTQREMSGKELNLLNHEFDGFDNWIEGKSVVDFGCGLGFQSAALANAGAKLVLGLDINQEYIDYANEYARKYVKNKSAIRFVTEISDRDSASYDLVISKNAMEHYTGPDEAIKSMKRLIHEDGTLMITFGPPWYSPYGSHMHFFCKLPWVNILFSEKAVMRVRGQYRDDGAKKYEDVESGLNKMSLSKFEKLCREQGLTVSYKKYSCIKGMNYLAAIPVLRELFVNRVTVILRPRNIKG